MQPIKLGKTNKYQIHFIFSFALFMLIKLYNSAPFCHITCLPNQCTTSDNTGCTACATNFVRSGSVWPSSCILDPSASNL